MCRTPELSPVLGHFMDTTLTRTLQSGDKWTDGHLVASTKSTNQVLLVIFAILLVTGKRTVLLHNLKKYKKTGVSYGLYETGNLENVKRNNGKIRILLAWMELCGVSAEKDA